MRISRLLAGIALTSSFLVGCSSDETEKTEKENVTEEISKEEPVSQKIEFGKDDTAIQEAIAAEEGVEKVELDSSSDGKALFLDVYVSSTEFASGEALVEKYVPQLQALHPEAKMDIVFVHGTSTIVYEIVVESKE